MYMLRIYDSSKLRNVIFRNEIPGITVYFGITGMFLLYFPAN